MSNPRYHFLHADICDAVSMRAALSDFRPGRGHPSGGRDHVDRSIDGQRRSSRPISLARSRCSRRRALLAALAAPRGSGSVSIMSRPTKFSVRWGRGRLRRRAATIRGPPTPRPRHPPIIWFGLGPTYGLPAMVTNCSNNYGPYHFPEKLIPLMIIKGLAGEPLPVYGDGLNVRDWLDVNDHARALPASSRRPGPARHTSSAAAPSAHRGRGPICASSMNFAPRRG